MSSDEFRRRGHELVDFIAGYLETVEDRPVLSRSAPGDALRALPAEPPPVGEAWDAIVADIDRVVMPGLTHWQSPHFHGFFPANSSFPAILAELLSSGLGVQGMLWATSPVATELETRVLDWLAGMIGLPDRFLSTARTGGVLSGGGVIHSTASEATLVALCAGRHRALHAHAGAATPPHLTIFASTQAHSSIIKAAMIAGLARGPDDRTHIRLIDTDADYTMSPAALDAAMQADVDAGRTPAFVCATVGTTSSTAIDPIGPIGEICRRRNAWLHVDAAFSGSACICPEFRAAHWGPLDGSGRAPALESVDSLVFNPHKWLLTNFDCSCVFTSDRASWTSAMSVTPEYLRNPASASGAVIDYRDWQVPLGRRFRALKLWFVIRHYGVEGLRAYIREHIRIAGVFQSLVESDPRFEVVTPRTSSLVCFRLRPRPGDDPAATDARNAALIKAVNDSGRAYLTHTILPPAGPHAAHSRYVLRMAIGSAQTQERHVREAWALIQRFAEV